MFVGTYFVFNECNLLTHLLIKYRLLLFGCFCFFPSSIKKCRFIIDPNPDFRQQLVLYELLLFGKSSVKPYLRSNEWGSYKLRALLNRSGIESWVGDRNNMCTLQ